jgi:acyl carrier protein
MEVEQKLRELLLPVLGFDTVDDVRPEHSLVQDLGAESLDFVEVLWFIEDQFKITLETNELVSGGHGRKVDELFDGGKLTGEGVAVLREQFPHSAHKIAEGFTKVEIFSLITVRDLATLVSVKLGMGA